MTKDKSNKFIKKSLSFEKSKKTRSFYKNTIIRCVTTD